MNAFRFWSRLSACAFISFASLWAQSLKLPSIFSDGLVLQAGEGTPVFGWAAPGAQVQVAFSPEHEAMPVQATATAGADGKWLVRLPPLAAGKKGALRIFTPENKAKGVKEETVVLNNAIVGEVWLCSGQSNMKWGIGSSTMTPESKQLAAKEAQQSAGNIRMFRVRQLGADAPGVDARSEAPNGGWEVVTAKNVNSCTAIGWNFAAALFQNIGAPVGVINSSWGGTPVEAWLPKEALDATSASSAVWKRHTDALPGWEPAYNEYKEKLAAFVEKYKTPAEQRQHKREYPREPYHPGHSNVPARLYNGMIHPLEPYGLRGVLWYQGETNGDYPRCLEYGELVQALVKSWRARFQNPDLAFYYVELENFKPLQTTPVQAKGWGHIREQQGAVLSLPHTGVATAVDLGEAANAHPSKKKEVADRLAGMALNDIYGKPSLCRSPEYVSSKIEGDKVVVRLANADGLRSRTEKIGGFAICGADGNWVWAENVKILPDGVLEISSAQVSVPVAARYAWADNPVISLENGAGLPLRPFRTDPQSKE